MGGGMWVVLTFQLRIQGRVQGGGAACSEGLGAQSGRGYGVAVEGFFGHGLAVGEHVRGDVDHELALEDDYSATQFISLAEWIYSQCAGEGQGSRGEYVRPGLRANDRTPLLFSLLARAAVKRMLAVLDCAYASQALYFSPCFALVSEVS